MKTTATSWDKEIKPFHNHHPVHHDQAPRSIKRPKRPTGPLPDITKHVVLKKDRDIREKAKELAGEGWRERLEGRKGQEGRSGEFAMIHHYVARTVNKKADLAQTAENRFLNRYRDISKFALKIMLTFLFSSV